MNYALLLKKIRDHLLITQTELARMIGVSFSTVNRWENNKTEPTMKAKRKIKSLCEKHKIEMENHTNE